MFIIFYEIKVIRHYEFVLAGQTVNSANCCEVSRRLHVNVLRLLAEVWRQKNRLLHYDNAPSHTSPFDQGILTKSNMTVVPHPPYSPALVPCDFALFTATVTQLR
jgi:histone-lysine N-methyltransferase SETMAR